MNHVKIGSHQRPEENGSTRLTRQQVVEWLKEAEDIGTTPADRRDVPCCAVTDTTEDVFLLCAELLEAWNRAGVADLSTEPEPAYWSRLDADESPSKPEGT